VAFSSVAFLFLPNKLNRAMVSGVPQYMFSD